MLIDINRARSVRNVILHPAFAASFASNQSFTDFTFGTRIQRRLTFVRIVETLYDAFHRRTAIGFFRTFENVLKRFRSFDPMIADSVFATVRILLIAGCSVRMIAAIQTRDDRCFDDIFADLTFVDETAQRGALTGFQFFAIYVANGPIAIRRRAIGIDRRIDLLTDR